jgi:SSS family solute:Na+ symporter
VNLPVIDLVIFLVYMAGIVLFGASFYFKKRSSSEYVSGGGRLPSWAIGMSIFATFVSSISFLALPGSAYLNNWNGYGLSLSIPVAVIIAVKYFVPLYRRINSISAYHFLEMRFGPWARVYASTCYLLTQLARMGAVMYLLALPLNALLGWSVPLIILITGISVIIYSTLGGLEAVIWTDTIQGIILIVGALLCPIIIMFSMPDGPAQIFTIADAADKFSLGSFGADLTESTFWVVFFYGLFINLQNFGIDQNYVQRYLSAKTERQAKAATWLGGLLYLPVSFFFFFIGTALFAYYQAMPELLPEHLKGTGNADKIFPYFIVSNLPSGLTGLIIAAIFAAGMSTISTSINSSATVILEDHFKKYINKNLSEKGSMKILTIASISMGLLSIIVALSLNGVKSALDAYWALASIFSGGILGLFLLAVLGKNVKRIYAVIGVILGVMVIGWMSLSPVFLKDGPWRSPFHANLTIVFGTL